MALHSRITLAAATGHSNQQIAVELGISEVAVARRLSFFMI
jgi:DNA-binding CsgD family transcriptional regulator